MDEALVIAARKALPNDVPASELPDRLRSAVWEVGRTAAVVSLPRRSGTALLVFLRQADGAFLAVDISGAESGNLSKLGVDWRHACERVESTPLSVERAKDGRFWVEVRTRAWRNGQRYTASERVLILADGTVMRR